MDPNNNNKLVTGSQTLLSGVEHSVQSFGRISHLLQMNFEALHMSFSSMVRLLGLSLFFFLVLSFFFAFTLSLFFVALF
jgi:hypothetical protein